MWTKDDWLINALTLGVQTSIEGAQFISDLDAKQERLIALEARSKLCGIAYHGNNQDSLADRIPWMN